MQRVRIDLLEESIWRTPWRSVKNTVNLGVKLSILSEPAFAIWKYIFCVALGRTGSAIHNEV